MVFIDESNFPTCRGGSTGLLVVHYVFVSVARYPYQLTPLAFNCHIFHNYHNYCAFRNGDGQNNARDKTVSTISRGPMRGDLLKED